METAHSAETMLREWNQWICQKLSAMKSKRRKAGLPSLSRIRMAIKAGVLIDIDVDSGSPVIAVEVESSKSRCVMSAIVTNSDFDIVIDLLPQVREMVMQKLSELEKRTEIQLAEKMNRLTKALEPFLPEIAEIRMDKERKEKGS